MNIALAKTETGRAVESVFSAARDRLPGAEKVAETRRQAFEAYERMANLATKSGVEGRTRIKIHTPLIRLSKAEIVKLGSEMGLDFRLTHSCYDPGPGGRPCGQCDSCVLRRKGFEEAGIKDPGGS